VWSFSVGTAVIASSRTQYQSSFQLCYTQREGNSVNWVNWSSFVGWVLVVWLFAIFVLVWCWYTLRGSDYQNTLRTRTDALLFSRNNVIVFTIFWGIVGIIYFFINQDISKNDPDSSASVLFDLFAGVFASLGTIDVLAWLITQRHVFVESQLYRSQSDVLSRASKLKSEKRVDDLSSTLRRDFVRFTVQGIVDSARLQTNGPAHYRARTPSLSSTSVEAQHEPLLGEHDQSGLHSNSPYMAMDDEDAASDVSELHGYAQVASHGQFDSTSTDDDLEDLELLGARDPPPLSLVREVGSRETFLFQDYQPTLFQVLRNRAFGVSDEEFISSFSHDLGLMQERFSEGRSGSFLFFTPDSRYIVKTLTASEHRFLLDILPHYARHMVGMCKSSSSRNLHSDSTENVSANSSLLTRFFGCYSITMYRHTQYFMVMENCLQTTENTPIHYRYDLKGSWLHRHADDPNPKRGVLKDNDFYDTIKLSRRVTRTLFVQVLQDVSFLQRLGIMDYSLLLGVHKCTESRDFSRPHCSGLAHDQSEYDSHVLFQDFLAGDNDDEKQRDITVKAPLSPRTAAMQHEHNANEPASLVTPSSSQQDVVFDANGEEAPMFTPLQVVASDSHVEDAPKRVSSRVSFAADALPQHHHATTKPSVRTSCEDSSNSSDAGLPRLRSRGMSQYKQYHGGISARVMEGAGIYFMGIIDLLQAWTIEKRAEHWLKRLRYCEGEFAMSAVPSKPYAQRFLFMMCDHLDTSLCALGGLRGVHLTVRNEKLDDSPDKRKLPRYQRLQYLIRMNYAGLLVERWEPISLILAHGWEGTRDMLSQWKSTFKDRRRIASERSMEIERRVLNIFS
jgi:1-phosphatidylinositol-4-phosphate 5-kinase